MACFPFPILGIDSDNGSEFINENLLVWCLDQKITFTRSRPGNKNDGKHSCRRQSRDNRDRQQDQRDCGRGGGRWGCSQMCNRDTRDGGDVEARVGPLLGMVSVRGEGLSRLGRDS